MAATITPAKILKRMNNKFKSFQRIRKIGSFISRSIFHYEHKLYPLLIIRGKWFKETGFNPGDQVLIRTELNKVIIEKMEG